jgi:VanZ family protein
MRPLKLTGLWQAMGWVYVALVIYYSLHPSPPELPSFQGADKLAHLSVYAIMMLWFGFIYLPGQRLLILGVFFVLLGIVLDLVQGATGYRSMELLDMIANAGGVCLGGLFARTRFASALVWLEDRLYGGRGSRKKNN